MLRVNLLKTTPEEVVRRFAEKHRVSLRPGRFVPTALRCAESAGPPPHFADTGEYRDGLVELQSEAAQLAALLTTAGPATTNVLDMCCGAGGKTLALASQMRNRGKLVATDTDSARLNRARARLERAGVTNCHRVLLAEGSSFFAEHKNHFERVLVDPPTSGVGQWKPSRQGITMASVAEVANEQS